MAAEIGTWIIGEARSGKTTQLVQQFCHWFQALPADISTPAAMILAANHTTGHQLNQKLTEVVKGSYPVIVKTPLGFMEDEVNLYSPLWWEKLERPPRFPLQLRSETEQAFAYNLWHHRWPQHIIPNVRFESRLVRITLDLLQLAGASGTPLEEIPTLLRTRLSSEEKTALGDEALLPLMGELILQWRDWCLERGFLTYGLIYYLYGQFLLPDPNYQEQLKSRYQAIFADDVDDYPAIAQNLASRFLQHQNTAVFTFNPNGKVRLGLTADPDAWEPLAFHCQAISLPPCSQHAPQATIPQILQMVDDPGSLEPLPDCIRSLQTLSRSQLLEETAQTIIHAVQTNQIAPEEIAIIAPGLDEIARYSLINRLRDHAIPVSPLHEQRPLISSPLVRALLTLTCLVYPHLGRLLDANAVAEMLVILTRDDANRIDPVRAGLIADYCYQADPSAPQLMDAKTFPRWDRLGYQAQTAYDDIRYWIQQQKVQSPTNLVNFLNQAIQQFLWKGNNLSMAELASLRELTETAQHYWEAHSRMPTTETMIEDFIKLLKQGTITANPYPLTSLNACASQGITLANIFQYRSQRSCHRWHFWLDISSSLWLEQGTAKLFASEIFHCNPYQQEALPSSLQAREQHLKRILQDLLNRVTETVYLCHSDLAVNGTEQMGILYPLVPASTPTELVLSS